MFSILTSHVENGENLLRTPSKKKKKKVFFEGKPSV